MVEIIGLSLPLSEESKNSSSNSSTVVAKNSTPTTAQRTTRAAATIQQQQQQQQLSSAWGEDGDESHSPPSTNKNNNHHHQQHGVLIGSRKTSTTYIKKTSFTPVDMDVLRGLDSDYVAAKQETTIGEQARRAWAFRSAMISILFIIVYLTAGIVFFRSQTDWSLPDTILFAVYSATSAGYGHVEIPNTVLFQMVDIVYVLIGIAALAIMVAQVYQYLQLEASRAEDRRRALELASVVAGGGRDSSGKKHKNRRRCSCLGDMFWSCLDRARPFFKETRLGQFLAVFLPLTALVLIGACTIGAIEGWTFVECVYFGVISLTTTGYGDYYPTKTSSIIICCFWLPCNIIFTSIYMGSVAKWYLNLSTNGIQRIRKSLRAKKAEELVFDRSISTPGNMKDISTNSINKVDIENGLSDESSSIGSDDDDDEPTATKSTKSSENGNPLEEDHEDLTDEDVHAPTTTVIVENMTSTLTTMADVIQAVQKHTEEAADMMVGQTDTSLLGGEGDDLIENATATESLRFMSLQPANEDKPCFTLRVLVAQRLAAIIAREVAGGNHNVDVQESYIVIRIGSWKEIATKWLIPSGAWKLFRAAALNAMMLVGERPLIQQGSQALFRLSPDEFYSMFSPLLAAMGDAETLQGWLNSTDDLALQYLVDTNHLTVERLARKDRKLHVEDDTLQMPKSQGTAFNKF